MPAKAEKYVRNIFSRQSSRKNVSIMDDTNKSHWDSWYLKNYRMVRITKNSSSYVFKFLITACPLWFSIIFTDNELEKECIYA